MDIIYPIYFTKKGRGIDWRVPRNRINITLRYENGSTTVSDYLSGLHLHSAFTFDDGYVSGYFIDDDEMVRVTNLVGYDGNNILKWCPNCKQIKGIEGFDYSGRYANGQRDQSNCKDCRSMY